MPIFQAIKIAKAATQPGYAGTITNRQVVLNTLKKSLLKPQKILHKIFLPEKIQKNLQSTLSPEIQSTPLGSWTQAQTLHIGLCEVDISIFQVDTFSWLQED